MAQKRKIQEAFGRPRAQLSAIAVARLAKQAKLDEKIKTSTNVEEPGADLAVPAVSHEAEPSVIVHRGQLVRDDVTKSPLKRHQQPDDLHGNDADDDWEFQLNSGEGLFFVGHYDVEVKTGLITVYGAALHSDSPTCRVCAPTTGGIPQVLSRKDGTIVVIKTVKSSLHKLGRVSPLFRNIWGGSETSHRSFHLVGHDARSIEDIGLTPLDIERDVQGIASRIGNRAPTDLRRARIVAIGTKSAGKSTLNRVMCNTILTRSECKKVLYLDLDPGQPEFGVPGQLSLVEVSVPILGPSFSHVATSNSHDYRLIRAHTIASTTFKDDPSHYTNCARDLVAAIDEDLPLIINSCGWVVGLGATVLAQLAQIIEFTDVIAFDPTDDSLLASIRPPPRKVVLHRLQRRANRPSVRTPAELRNMQTLAYFHRRLQTYPEASGWISQSIETFRPYVVPFTGEGSILGILSYGQVPNPEFLHEVLEGSLVAITTVDPVLFHLQSSTSSRIATIDLPMIERTPQGLPFFVPTDQGFCPALEPQKSEFVSLGLIRSVDVASGELQIVTPMSDAQAAQLAKKTVVLVRGNFDSPDWAYLESLYVKGEVSESEGMSRPWVSRKGMVGIEGAVWRLRHPPVATSGSGSKQP